VQVPKPDRDSGSLRMLNLLRLLRGLGCSVSFLPDSREREGDYATALEQLGVEVWSREWLGQMPRWFAAHGHRFDLVIASRHYVASSYAPLIREHAPGALLAFDTVDLHFLREAREAEVGGAVRGAERTRQRELAMISAADVSFVVSSHERELLAELLPGADVRVLSNVHRVAGRRAGFSGRRDIVFVGGFRHPPNVDAVLWLVQSIWPRVRAALPEARLHVVGGDVPSPVAALGNEPGVEVHGYLPDIEPLMDGCRLAVAPLRYGAGVKGKINLSMAHGQPVVSTTCGVEGMHLRPGADVLVADEAEAFAGAVVAAYTDEALWLRLSEAGLDNVRRHFSFEAAQAVLEPVLAAARARRRASR
jgi:glycosyltransferase involved in cell wall biosynthesis